MIRARCGHCNNPTGIYNPECRHRAQDAAEARWIAEWHARRDARLAAEEAA